MSRIRDYYRFHFIEALFKRAREVNILLEICVWQTSYNFLVFIILNYSTLLSNGINSITHVFRVPR